MWLVTIHCFPTSNSQQPYGFFCLFQLHTFQTMPLYYAAFDHKEREKRAVKKQNKNVVER